MIAQIALGFLTFVAVIFSIFGDTWRPQEEGWRRISLAGWFIIFTATVSFSLSSYLIYSSDRKSEWVKKSVYSYLIDPLYEVSKITPDSSNDYIQSSCENLEASFEKVSGALTNDFAYFNAKIAVKECRTNSTDFWYSITVNMAIAFICDSSKIYRELEACTVFKEEGFKPEKHLNFNR